MSSTKRSLRKSVRRLRQRSWTWFLVRGTQKDLRYGRGLWLVTSSRRRKKSAIRWLGRQRLSKMRRSWRSILRSLVSSEANLISTRSRSHSLRFKWSQGGTCWCTATSHSTCRKLKKPYNKLKILQENGRASIGSKLLQTKKLDLLHGRGSPRKVLTRSRLRQSLIGLLKKYSELSAMTSTGRYMILSMIQDTSLRG